MKAAAAQITLNLAEIAALARQQPIAYTIGGQPIEITLQRDITPSLLIGLMVDLLGGQPAIDPNHPPDPPEAYEFLPRRSQRKNPRR